MDWISFAYGFGAGAVTLFGVFFVFVKWALDGLPLFTPWK